MSTVHSRISKAQEDHGMAGNLCSRVKEVVKQRDSLQAVKEAVRAWARSSVVENLPPSH
jgi:hypothetical protein